MFTALSGVFYGLYIGFIDPPGVLGFGYLGYIRRLPVMGRGRVAGVVTDKMLLSYSPGKATSLDTWEAHYLLSKTPVKEAMNPNPHMVRPETDIRDAAKLLHDRKLNGVLVLNATGDLVGIFTTTNALEALIDICDSEQQAATGTAGRKP